MPWNGIIEFQSKMFLNIKKTCIILIKDIPFSFQEIQWCKKYFQKVQNDQDYQENTNYYLGFIAYQLENFEEANENFDKLNRDNDKYNGLL